MKKMRPLGLILGLAGNLLLGIAIYRLISAGSCGDFGQPPCTESSIFFALALPVAIALSVLAAFLGGGIFSFAGSFLAVGLGAMASSAFNPGGETETFGWIFGGIFTLVGLLPLLLIPLALKAAKKEQRQLDLLKTGRSGIGTVVRVKDTGITINDDPQVEIVVRVEPTDGGAAIERRKLAVASRVAIPRAGDRYPVWYDPADPDLWFMVTEVEPHAPEEVRRLFAKAREGAGPASPVDELERLNALRREGALTEAEFAAAKARLLGS
jgi:hypothetical protein